MENIDPKHQEDSTQPMKPIERNYSAHDQDPGPSPQAIKEDDNKGAGQAMKWAIPIIVVILFLVYWFLF